MLYNFFMLLLSTLVIFLNINTKRKSLLITLLFLCSVSIIFVALSLNTQNPDYEGYIKIFDNPYLYTDIGYVKLIECLKFIGLGSHRYILVLLSLLIVFTFFRILKYAHMFGVFVLLYLLFLFPLDVTQIRNTFMVFFAINAFFYYFEKKKIRFILFILLQCSFHYLGILLLLLYPISLFMRGKRKITISILFFVLSFIIMFFAKSYLYLISIRTLSSYISPTIKIYSLAIWGTPLFFFIIITQFKKSIRNIINKDSFLNYLYSFMLSMLCFLPLVVYFTEFNRVFRLSFLIILILSSYIFRYLNLTERLVLSLFLILLFSSFSLFYSYQLNYDWILFDGLRFIL